MPTPFWSRNRIESIVAQAMPEGQDIEFKESLSARDGLDPWHSGADSISNRARDQIVQEVIAFANSYGGTVLFGIGESADAPPRAARISPLPRCHELAERIKLQLRDCIDPGLATAEVFSVEMDSNGGGVVGIDVRQSPLRPHRSRQDQEAYIRRNNRTERMTMREIHDLVILRERGATRVAEAFRESRRLFEHEIGVAGATNTLGAMGVRVDVVPMAAPIYADPVVLAEAFEPVNAVLSGRIAGRDIQLFGPSNTRLRRTILRGVRWYASDSQFDVKTDVHFDGRVAATLIERPLTGAEAILFAEWSAAMLANALLTAVRLTDQSQLANIEFGVQVEIRSTEVDLQLAVFGASQSAHFGRIALEPPRHILLPEMSFLARDEIPTIVGLVVRDLYNCGGRRWDTDSWELDLPPST